MKNQHLIIDIEKCEDCNNCFLACKDEFVDNDFPGYSVAQPKHGHRWVDILRHERGQCPMVDVAYLPKPCMHCEIAPCVAQSKNGAVTTTSDGITIIDPQKAIGQKEIVDACPYGAIWWNEEQNLPQKCTMCAHLLTDGWKTPRCVQACPTGALRFEEITDSDLRSQIDSGELEPLYPEYNTKPRVLYKNLYRYFTCFIGGTVAVKTGEVTDCAENVKVSLFKDSNQVNSIVTDNYGDFKIDKLEKNSGAYTLELDLDGYEKKRMDIELTESVYLGEILFSGK